MAEPIIKHYEIRSGNSLKLTVTVLDADEQPKNLGGALITYICEPLDNSIPAITRTIGNGITVTDAAGGVMEIIIPKDKILGARYQTTNWKHELRVNDGNDELTVMEGVITVAG